MKQGVLAKRASFAAGLHPSQHAPDGAQNDTPSSLEISAWAFPAASILLSRSRVLPVTLRGRVPCFPHARIWRFPYFLARARPPLYLPFRELSALSSYAKAYTRKNPPVKP